ncbi:hypothetical protein BC834DRAFT_141059 [Gloeopeniophorella convolvens]|nr:hypothetical protein BC834DRAFT_141059 [Gloeopeniophorella convolvens]
MPLLRQHPRHSTSSNGVMDTPPLRFPTPATPIPPNTMALPWDSTSSYRNRFNSTPLWIVCCLFAATTMLCASIATGWSLRVLDLKASLPRPSAGRNVWFELDLISLDPLQNVATFDWWIVGDDCLTDTAGRGTQAVCPVVNIFINPNEFLSSPGAQNIASDASPRPIFQHNATGSTLSGNITRPSFRTQLEVHSVSARSRVYAVDYPFDRYYTIASIFAQTNDTGTPVGAWVSSLSGNAFGFIAQLGNVNTDVNNVTSNSFLLKRALPVKIYVITIVVGMWLISLSLMVCAMKAVIFRYQVEASVLVLPVGTMIAFAQLRGSMPNAPSGFGTNIDLVGALPTYVCLVFTAVISLVNFVVKSSQKDAPPSPNAATAMTPSRDVERQIPLPGLQRSSK